MKTSNATSVPLHVPVIIIGGGAVGSGLAIELRLRGIDVLVVERETDIRDGHPKARSNSMRTLEHYRRWGVSDALREHAWTTRDPVQQLVITESLLSEPLGAYPLRYGRHIDESWNLATEPSLSVPQPVTMRILRDRSIELGARWRSGWEALEVDQDADGVTTTLRAPDGTLEIIRSEYVVGCDGPNSLVRHVAGIERAGDAPLCRTLTYVVRSKGYRIADLIERAGYEAIGMLAVFNENASSIISIPDDEHWGFGISRFDESEPTPDEIERYGQHLLGAKVPIEVVSQSSYLVRTRVAQRYRNGRLFIAGDAAHVCPPTGGHNMNVGIGDAVDLGWKLAAVLLGWGGDALLDSYDLERRPIAERVSRSSLDNSHSLAAAKALARGSDFASQDDSQHARVRRGEALYRLTYAEWNTHGVVLDQRYDESPVIISDGTTAPPWQETEYWPHARPGHRAPHLRLHDTSPLYDRLGAHFTLLDVDADEKQAARLLEAANQIGIPVTRLKLPSAIARPHYPAELTLIRPDQHIGWQGNRSDDALVILQRLAGLFQHEQHYVA